MQFMRRAFCSQQKNKKEVNLRRIFERSRQIRNILKVSWRTLHFTRRKSLFRPTITIERSVSFRGQRTPCGRGRIRWWYSLPSWCACSRLALALCGRGIGRLASLKLLACWSDENNSFTGRETRSWNRRHLTHSLNGLTSLVHWISFTPHPASKAIVLWEIWWARDRDY